MTMDDVKAMTCDFITPAVAASVLKMDTGRLVAYAKAGQLPFPVQISGNRVKISRIGFLKQYGYADPEEEKPEDKQMKRLLEEVHLMNIGVTAMNTVLMAIADNLMPGFAEEMVNRIRSKGGTAQ